MNLNEANNIFTAALVYGGMVLAAAWLGMVIWTYRDMRSRSRDKLAPALVALMTAVLTFPGLIIYLFLRPRETLSEAYERSLEEEALLQEIEEKPTCPGCRQRVHQDWQACPNCHTRLKRPCVRCSQLLELSWDLCPHCATPVANYADDRAGAGTTAIGRGTAPMARPAQDWRGYDRRRDESIEFIDGDEGQQ
jgi:RNA polymerase subunit RPABC4/transcription elongation factor Spt4